MKQRLNTLVTTAAAVAMVASTGLSAQELFIYPNDGQSAEQQQKDRYECHVWAAEQTGFDPTRAVTALPTAPAQGDKNDVGSLIGGAALGTAVGAIAGKDIAESAAIGAGASVLGSRLKNKRAQQKAQKAYEADIAFNQAYATSKRADYDRAMGACLTGRGYTVK